jgi:5-methylcytosine-specific restriction endonuclease McrA
VTRHGRRSWGGRKVAQFRALVLATYGTTCHLCERPGADSPDHIVPVCEAPHLEWDLANVRPAHRNCNYSRGSMPLDQWFAQRETRRVALAPSRDW